MARRVIRWSRRIAEAVLSVIPWIVRLLRFILIIVSTSLQVWWLGVPEARERIADRCWERVEDSGITTDLKPTVMRIARWSAVIVMVIFFIITAEIAVLIMRRLF